MGASDKKHLLPPSDCFLRTASGKQSGSAEIFRVEEYVEMVLGYLRSEDMSSDMKFAEWDLDKIIREQIHKYASVFIGKAAA